MTEATIMNRVSQDYYVQKYFELHAKNTPLIGCKIERTNDFHYKVNPWESICRVPFGYIHAPPLGEPIRKWDADQRFNATQHLCSGSQRPTFDTILIARQFRSSSRLHLMAHLQEFHCIYPDNHAPWYTPFNTDAFVKETGELFKMIVKSQEQTSEKGTLSPPGAVSTDSTDDHSSEEQRDAEQDTGESSARTKARKHRSAVEHNDRDRVKEGRLSKHTKASAKLKPEVRRAIDKVTAKKEKSSRSHKRPMDDV